MRAVIDRVGIARRTFIWMDPAGNHTGFETMSFEQTPFPLLAAGTGWAIVDAASLDGTPPIELILRHDDGRLAGWQIDSITSAVRAATLWLPAGSGWSLTQVRDLDGDGKKDLLLTHADGTAAAWLMNGLSIRAAGVLVNSGSGWALAP